MNGTILLEKIVLEIKILINFFFCFFFAGAVHQSHHWIAWKNLAAQVIILISVFIAS
jgi:hypothetical protein